MKTRSAGTNQRRSHTPFLASSLVLLVVTAACGERADTTGNPLEGSRWEMTSVRDGNVLVAANPTTIATAVFADGQAFGSTGCNGYGFSYAFDGNTITFKDPVLSSSACDPDHAGQGDAFIQAVQASERFVLSGDGLELTDAAGAAQVVFRPTTELPLTWVAWQLVWYGGGTSPLEGTQISLAFRDDGTLTGIAGCNSYFADYEIDGDQFVIGAIAPTKMACMDPDGVMTQETDYLKTLDRAVAFTTTLTGLELFDADGHPVAEYRFGGRVRTTGGDHELEEAAFIDLTRDAAIQVAVDHGRLWRISRQNDDYFAHDAQILIGRVTFEIDNGKVDVSLHRTGHATGPLRMPRTRHCWSCH